MNFQFLIVLSLACASSAQYYYTRPLSGYGSYSSGAPMAPKAPMASEPKMMGSMTTGSNMMGSKTTGSNMMGSMTHGSMTTGSNMMGSMTTESNIKEEKLVFPATTERVLTTDENPCTAEVLRSNEIQAFKDPLSASSYIVCTDIDIFVRMPCASGTIFNTEIKHCVPEGWVKPLCPVGLCKNEGDCIIDEIKNEYKCLCRVGFTGLFCETNIDECALEGNAVCSKAGGRCVDQINAWYCDFGATIGFSVEDAIEKPCTLKDLAEERQFVELPCAKKNAYLQCTGEKKWFVSRCADMLFWNQELKTCSIEKPLLKTGICKTLPCKNDGICEDLGDFNFKCSCGLGFTGALCEEPIDLCLSSPCGAGRCVAYPGGYNCLCQNKIVDKSCEMTLMNPCREVSEHHSHPMTIEKYVSCGLDGLAFVKSCPPSTTWDNLQKACIAPLLPVVPVVAVKPPKKSIYDRPAVMTVPKSSMVTIENAKLIEPIRTGSMSGSMNTGSMSGSMTRPMATGSMSKHTGSMSGSMTGSYPGY